jgi:hypothetical protein
MCDLHTAAEELRRIEAAVAEQFAAIPKPEAPDKPSERVETAAIAVGVLTLFALLGQAVVYAMA